MIVYWTVNHQHKVEDVPAELRSSVALEAYFDDLFPGQVHR